MCHICDKYMTHVFVTGNYCNCAEVDLGVSYSIPRWFIWLQTVTILSSNHLIVSNIIGSRTHDLSIVSPTPYRCTSHHLHVVCYLCCFVQTISRTGIGRKRRKATQ